MNNGLRIKDGQYEHITFRTSTYETELEAYYELEAHLQGLEGKFVFIRQAPIVDRQLNYDTKKREFVGSMRYAILEQHQ